MGISASVRKPPPENNDNLSTSDRAGSYRVKEASGSTKSISSSQLAPSLVAAPKAKSKSISTLGVKFSFFQVFIEHCGGEDELVGKTTYEVCENYLIPFTKNSELSLCEQLLELGREKGAEYVGAATWYVSHTWQYRFLDVIEAIGVKLEEIHPQSKEEQEDTIVWFDLFSNSQHDTDKQTEGIHDQEFFASSLKHAISGIGNMMMVFLPWDKCDALTRSWCLYEAYICHLLSSSPTTTTVVRFEIAMTSAELRRFYEMIYRNVQEYYSMLQKRIDVEAGEATNPDEQTLILEVMKQTVQTTSSQQTQQTQQSSSKSLENSLGGGPGNGPGNGPSGSGNGAKSREGKKINAHLLKLFEQCLISSIEGKIKLLMQSKEPTVNTYKLMSILAAIYRNRGAYDQAERLYRLKLEGFTKKYGSDHPHTLAIVNNLAVLYHDQGKYDAAEPLYEACLQGYIKQHGRDHADTLTFMNNLASLYRKLGQYEKAEELYGQSLDGSRRVYGEDHAITLNLLTGLGNLYFTENKYHFAEPLYLQSLTCRERLLGSEHLDTLQAKNNLAVLYYYQGKYDESHVLFEATLIGKKKLLGEEHEEVKKLQDEMEKLWQKLTAAAAAAASSAASAGGSSNPVIGAAIARVSSIVKDTKDSFDGGSVTTSSMTKNNSII